MISDGIVKINDEEYVLWYTEDEYDIETCVQATPKKDFDRLMNKYKDMDCLIYNHNIFIYDGNKFEELIKEWIECYD